MAREKQAVAGKVGSGKCRSGRMAKFRVEKGPWAPSFKDARTYLRSTYPLFTLTPQ